jgi:uncharacterized protein with HEPN domain
MSPRDLVYVGHMLDMAKKAMSKTQGLSRGAYDADENLRLALIHLVQIIGEAGRQVSREFSDQHPEIPWADIVGMRHKVVHDYLGVDEDIVWQVVTEDLPHVGGRARTDRPADASSCKRAMNDRCESRRQRGCRAIGVSPSKDWPARIRRGGAGHRVRRGY